jgi:hypothetical protein
MYFRGVPWSPVSVARCFPRLVISSMLKLFFNCYSPGFATRFVLAIEMALHFDAPICVL